MDQATCAPSDQRRHLKTARPTAQLVQGRRDWFRITNLGDSTAELLVYDEIGYFGVSASDLIGQLSALNVKDLSVRLSSPGGDVFDGIAIMNALRSHPARVTVQVDALAASIASVIAMAGDEIVMAPHSEMMIHEASGVAIGDAATMREMADLLDRQSDKIAGIYAERAGGQRPSWRKRMRAETWYTAEEAVTAGLADRVADLKRKPSCEDMPEEPGEHEEEHGEDMPMPMAASWDLSIFRYPGRKQAPDPLNDTHLVGEHGPELVNVEPGTTVIPVADTAVGTHDTPSEDGTWDAGENVGRLPSPMPVATAKKVYAWYDSGQVEDGNVIKGACKLPHHFVDADGTPGAASLNGVRNALSRLPQTEGLSDAERTTIENHLRSHLPDEPADTAAAAQTITVTVTGPTGAAGEELVKLLRNEVRYRGGPAAALDGAAPAVTSQVGSGGEEHPADTERPSELVGAEPEPAPTTELGVGGTWTDVSEHVRAEPAAQEPAAQAAEPEPPADADPVPAVPADWAAATAHLDRRDEWGDLVASLTSDNAVFARLRENLL